MATQLPIIGSWFKDIVSGQLFEVVALDEQEHCIEIQDVDGNLAEYDYDSWAQLELSPAAAPEDASVGYEMMREDQWGSDTYYGFESNPLAMIEPDSFPGIDDF